MAAQRSELVEQLLAAYAQGYFPMAEPPRGAGRGGGRGGGGGAAKLGAIRWYNPDPRAVIPLGEEGEEGGFHVSRSLRRRLRSGAFAMSSDRDFEGVIRACAEARPGREETWIDERIVAAYTELHRAGFAHSIEARLAGGGAEGPLVGGIYGVSIGGAFFAESKFSRPELGGTDASKVCLAHLVEHLRRRGFTMLDVQFWNPHIDQFGVVEIPRREYLKRLEAAVAREVAWGEFEAAAAGFGSGLG